MDRGMAAAAAARAAATRTPAMELQLQHLLLLLLALAANRVVYAAKPKQLSQPVFQIHSLDPCKAAALQNQPPPPVSVTHYTITRARNGATFLDANITNAKLAKTFSKVECSVTTCNDAVSYNTCEYMGTWQYSVGLCQLVRSENTPWGTFFNSIHPSAECPFQPGSYVMSNGTLDLDGLKKLVGPVWTTAVNTLYNKFYITDIKVFNENGKLHVCETIKSSFGHSRS